jgi:hypothetical protein
LIFAKTFLGALSCRVNLFYNILGCFVFQERLIMKILVNLMALVFFSCNAFAQNPADFNLAPGEILVSVNGVPVQSDLAPISRAINATERAIRSTGSMVGSVISSRVVNRNDQAFQHALAEAQILARTRSKGHPMGVAPGCKYSGTGISYSPEIPSHCYSNLPEERLMARAVVHGPDNNYYWSAHYR